MSFALATPVLLGAVGIAADLGVATMKKSELQSLADQAALSAAQEIAIGNVSSNVVAETVSAYVNSQVEDTSRTINKESAVNDNNTSVKVTLTETWAPFFAHFVGFRVTPISSNATASLAGKTNICVLALETEKADAVSLKANAHVEARNCAVYSNSVNTSGITMANKSAIDAPLVCSAGGISGRGQGNIKSAVEDCPTYSDPLASRSAPTVGPCDSNDVRIQKGSVTLTPGVYCGGLSIGGTAKVTFSPGLYIVRDGEFRVFGKAEVTGEKTTFFMTGTGSNIQFHQNALIRLSGAETGGLAGLLFYEDPKETSTPAHVIRSSRVEELTGTIYLPRGELRVDPNANVGQSSAYTAIVTRALRVDNGPHLILNSNYSDTEVPVPDGIRSKAQVVLTD